MPPDLSRRRFLQGAAATLPAGWAWHDAHAQVATSSLAPTKIDVNARKIPFFDPRDESHVRYGSLEFRSGLVLTSSHRGFGGLSGLHLDKKGEQFVTLSDKGEWFTGRLVYVGKNLTGLADVMAAPMLAGDGKRITSRGWFDTESLTFDGAIAYVGIERANQILRFDFAKGGIASRGEPIAVPDGVSRLPFNKGLESIAFVPKGQQLSGALIAISERGLDADGNIMGFLIGGPMPGSFTVKRDRNFDISDAMILPSGDLLLLERKFSMLEGVGIRIRRVPLAMLKPNAVIDGPTIFDVDLGYEVDNMEGIASHVTPEGETVLTMISDDNFSMIQRTLILQFTLVDA